MKGDITARDWSCAYARQDQSVDHGIHMSKSSGDVIIIPDIVRVARFILVLY